MRNLILLSLLVSGVPALSQSQSSNHLSHRFSFVGGGLLGTGRSIQQLTTGSVSTNTIPGFAATAEYSALINGLTGSVGLGIQLLPAGVKYRLPQESFNLSEPIDDFVGRLAEYSVPLSYLPVKLGYTFKEMNHWQPSILAGVNIYSQYSYSVSNTRSYRDPVHGRLPVSRFVARSPHGGEKRWMQTYTATIRMAKIMPNNGQLLVGLIANFSNKTLYTGNFQVAYQDGLQLASYNDNGSFIGIQFGYTLPKKSR